MDEDERRLFISRIGTFFFLLGIFGGILFIASDFNKNTNFGFFFVAIILLIAGWLFKRITAQTPIEGKRFEGIRKFQQKRREVNAKKEATKNDKNKTR